MAQVTFHRKHSYVHRAVVTLFGLGSAFASFCARKIPDSCIGLCYVMFLVFLWQLKTFIGISHWTTMLINQEYSHIIQSFPPVVESTNCFVYFFKLSFRPFQHENKKQCQLHKRVNSGLKMAAIRSSRHCVYYSFPYHTDICLLFLTFKYFFHLRSNSTVVTQIVKVALICLQGRVYNTQQLTPIYLFPHPHPSSEVNNSRHQPKTAGWARERKCGIRGGGLGWLQGQAKSNYDKRKVEQKHLPVVNELSFQPPCQLNLRAELVKLHIM